MSSGSSSRSDQSPVRATSSKSHSAPQISSFFFEITVNRRHWERLAVFRPSPKRPRSRTSRVTSGLRLPCLIASISSALHIPRPSSANATNGSSNGENETSTAEHWAAMLLSTRSAMADSNEYPIARIASSKVDATGGVKSPFIAAAAQTRCIEKGCNVVAYGSAGDPSTRTSFTPVEIPPCCDSF